MSLWTNYERFNMRIAIVITRFPPKWLAGAEIATYNLAKYLSLQGHEIHVFTSFDEGIEKSYTENGFQIHRIDFPRLKIIGLPIFWLKACLSIKKLNPDLIHTQTIHTSFLGLVLKVFLKKPYIVWARGSDVYLSEQYKFLKPFTKSILKHATVVIALTKDMQNAITRIYPRDVEVVPNGIDTSRFDNIESKKEKINSGKKLLYVGRLVPVKGVVDLIDSMKYIIEKNQDVELIIIGDGTLRKELENKSRDNGLSDHICFKGEVPNEVIPQCMISADIFILPSYSEGFPNCLLEAMAAGLPIVCTNIKGLPDIVEDNINGFLVQPNDPKSICEKVNILLDNDLLRDKISKNNLEKVQLYSWENIVKKLEEIYEKADVKQI